MKREDLFLAIGAVEESRLARSDLAVSGPSGACHKEEANMKKKGISARRIIRSILVAALVLSMVSITAYAAVGYLIFDSPSEMLTSIFGDKTGYDHKDVTQWTDPEKPGSVYDNPAYDRVPVDEAVAQSEAAPMVSPVGQSISWQGYTLTVDANMYDQVTKCGVLTYTIENPNGMTPYVVGTNGMVTFPDGELLYINQYGYSYIIRDQSSDTKLTAAYYYNLWNPDNPDMEITISEYALMNTDWYRQKYAEIEQQFMQEVSEEEAYEYEKQSVGDFWQWFEENYTREQIVANGYRDMLISSEELAALDAQCICPDKIAVPEKALGEMSSVILGDGRITISPIAIYVDATDISDYPQGFVAVTKIRFEDGTEYVVKDDNTANYMFALGSSEKRDVTYMFNRIIDVNEIASVILDGGLEFSAN